MNSYKIMQNTKTCKGCKEEKLLTAFTVIRNKHCLHTYFQTYCKPCMVERTRKTYRNNTEYRQRQKDRNKTPEARAVRSKYMVDYRKKRKAFKSEVL